MSDEEKRLKCKRIIMSKVKTSLPLCCHCCNIDYEKRLFLPLQQELSTSDLFWCDNSGEEK